MFAVLPLLCLRSGGLGQIDHSHLYKNDPDLGMLVVKIGGPAYRIGMGGGAASSVPSGSNSADLDFNAVQVGSPGIRRRCQVVAMAAHGNVCAAAGCCRCCCALCCGCPC